MRVALFATCLVDTMVPQVARATAVLLERLGHEVVVPAGQACCGQMHVNTGYRRDAVQIIANHVRAFAGAEAIVAPSGSCVASIHHQQAAVLRRAGETALAHEAEALAERTYELSQFLVDVLGVTDVGAYYPHRVTYHPTCHSLRLLRVGDRPLRLLRAVRGLELAELPGAEQCCGFGGTFAVKNADTSTAMLTDKMANVLSTHAEVCTAGDASCLLHIGGGLSRLRSGTRTVHLAEILASTEEAVSPSQSTRPAVPACPPPSWACRRRRAGWATSAATVPSRTPPGTLSATGSCGPTWATRRRRSGPSGQRPSPRSPTGPSSARPAALSRPPRWRASMSCWSSWRPGSPNGAAPCTGPGTPTRPTGSSPTSYWPRAPTRWSRSSRWPPRRSG